MFLAHQGGDGSFSLATSKQYEATGFGSIGIVPPFLRFILVSNWESPVVNINYGVSDRRGTTTPLA